MFDHKQADCNEAADMAAQGRGTGRTTSAVLRAFLIALPCNGGKSVDVVAARLDHARHGCGLLSRIVHECGIVIESESASHIQLHDGGMIRFYDVGSYAMVRSSKKGRHTIYDLNDERRD